MKKVNLHLVSENYQYDILVEYLLFHNPNYEIVKYAEALAKKYNRNLKNDIEKYRDRYFYLTGGVPYAKDVNDNVYFENYEHRARFYQLLAYTGFTMFDNDRRALLYILTSDVLHYAIDRIYDIELNQIIPECYNEAFLTSGTKIMIDVAFNLYNNFCQINLRELATLSDNNFKIIMQAIELHRSNCLLVDAE